MGAIAVPESTPAQLWKALFETALDAMVIADNAGGCVEVNGAACAMLEQPRQRLIGRSIADFLGSDTAPGDFWPALMAAGQLRGEQQLRLDSGVVKTAEFAATAHVYPNHHLLIWRDITDRKRTEAERDGLSRQLEQWVISSAEKLQLTEAKLRSQQQRIDSILNSLECVVWSVHPETLETIYVNAAAEVLFGYSPEAFAADANPWFRCVHPDDTPLLLADFQALHDEKKSIESTVFCALTARCAGYEVRLV